MNGKTKKCTVAALGILLVILIAGMFLAGRLGGSTGRTETVVRVKLTDDVTRLIDTKVADSFQDYFGEPEVSITSSDVEYVTTSIESGVQEALDGTEVDEDALRDLIREAVQDSFQIDDGTDSVLSDALDDYISNTIVPGIVEILNENTEGADTAGEDAAGTGTGASATGDIALSGEEAAAVVEALVEQITNNENLTDAEKESLKESVQNIPASDASTVGALITYLTQYIDTTNTKLTAVINNYSTSEEFKNEVMQLISQSYSSDEFTLQAIGAVNGMLLTEDDLAAIQTVLLEKIDSNATLSDSEQKLLKESISSLDTAVASNYSELFQKIEDGLSAQATDLSTEVAALLGDIDTINRAIAALDTRITNLTDVELVTLKDSLTAQIEANTQLTESVKQELIAQINTLSATTTDGLAAQLASLTEKIDAESAANSKALSDALKELYGSTEDTGKQMSIPEITALIESNKSIADSDKASLLALIDEKYNASADALTTSVADLAKQIADSSAANSQALSDALAVLYGSGDTDVQMTVPALEELILTGSSISDEDKDALVKLIEEKYGSLPEGSTVSVSGFQKAIEDAGLSDSKTLSGTVGELCGTDSSSRQMSIPEITALINSNKEITDADKAELIALVNEKYADASDSITTSIAGLTADLQAEVEARNAAIAEVTATLKETLDTDIANLTSRVSKNEADIAALKEQVLNISDTELAAMKASLTAQINENTALTESAKAELLEEIDSLSASTSTELTEQLAGLTQRIEEESAANSAALTEALEKIYGGEEGDNPMSIADITQLISDNQDLAEEEKESLLALIEEKYKDASDSATTSINALATDLQAEVDARDTAITEATAALKTALDEDIGNLASRVAQNEADIAAISGELSDYKDAVDEKFTSLLSGCTIYESGGSFYVTNGSATVKLGYAE